MFQQHAVGTCNLGIPAGVAYLVTLCVCLSARVTCSTSKLFLKRFCILQMFCNLQTPGGYLQIAKREQNAKPFLQTYRFVRISNLAILVGVPHLCIPKEMLLHTPFGNPPQKPVFILAWEYPRTLPSTEAQPPWTPTYAFLQVYHLRIPVGTTFAHTRQYALLVKIRFAFCSVFCNLQIAGGAVCTLQNRFAKHCEKCVSFQRTM